MNDKTREDLWIKMLREDPSSFRQNISQELNEARARQDTLDLEVLAFLVVVVIWGVYLACCATGFFTFGCK